VITAVLTAVVAVTWLQEPLSRTVVASALVGGGTFAVLLGYRLLRAPTEIEAERRRRLEGWRQRFAVDAEVRGSSVLLSLYAPHAGEMAGSRCVVRHDSGHEWESRHPQELAGLVSGINMARCVWRFPSGFDAPDPERPGHYTALWFLATHEESVGTAEWTR
jgi:hypothetical protein